MSKYDIRSYQEEYLEAQEKVGKEATKDWRAFGQTSASQLKKAYSQPGFDPETKLYAFDKDQLVGFITSNIIEEKEDGIKRALLEFPLTLPEHEECAEMLFSKAIENLQKKGVKKVQTRVGEFYKGTIEKAENWGYNYSQDLYVLMEAIPSNISIEKSEFEVSEFDFSQDSESLIQIFVKEYGSTEEYAKDNIERISKDKESFPIHMVIRENGKLVGRVLVYKSQKNPQEFNFGSIYFKDEKYFSTLLSTGISRIKELGAEKTSLFLYGETLPLEEKYKSFGFSRSGKIDYYEKEI
ncbi:MAG: hypothetical protein ACTSSH_09560 [Candidatus Heimdallarchaeota archaeon]